jgi:hypothetical protein
MMSGEQEYYGKQGFFLVFLETKFLNSFLVLVLGVSSMPSLSPVLTFSFNHLTVTKRKEQSFYQSADRSISLINNLVKEKVYKK